VEKAILTTVLERQHDDAWLGDRIRGSVSRQQLAGFRIAADLFQSEEDGWSHLYTVTMTKSEDAAHKGTFEVYDPAFERQKRWYFSSTKCTSGTSFLFMRLRGNSNTIHTMEGVTNAHSPNGRSPAVLYSFTTKCPAISDGCQAGAGSSNHQFSVRTIPIVLLAAPRYSHSRRDGANVRPTL